jgi:hypothetical protein
VRHGHFFGHAAFFIDPPIGHQLHGPWRPRARTIRDSIGQRWPLDCFFANAIEPDPVVRLILIKYLAVNPAVPGERSYDHCVRLGMIQAEEHRKIVAKVAGQQKMLSHKVVASLTHAMPLLGIT